MAGPWLEFTDIAVITTLRTSVGAGATTIPLTLGSGWPTPTGGKSAIATIGDPLAGQSEEKILFTGRSGDDLTGVTRGYGGTAPQEWDQNTRIRHTISGAFMAEVSDHIHSGGDDHLNYLTTARHAAILHTQAMMGVDSVGAAQIIADSVGQSELGPGAVGTPELIDLSVTPAKLHDSTVALLNPPGVLLAYAGTVAPSGWLLCDGAAVSRTTFAALFAVTGTAFGIGNGTTTFNLPDLRGRFPLGKATAGTGSTLGGTGGAINHVHDLDTPSSHARINWTTSSGVDDPQMRERTGVPSWSSTKAGNVNFGNAIGTSFTGGAELAGNSDTANPPFQSVNYIVKT